MNGFKEVYHFLLDMDLFGKSRDLYFKGKTKKPSKIGLFLTIIYVILYISFLIYKLIRMVRRVDVTFYDSYAYKDFPSLKLTNEEFYGGFSMGGIIDETLYYATADFVSGVKEGGQWHYTTTNLEVETCKLERFGSKYKDLFRDQPLKNLYCIKHVNFTLEGYANLDRYSYISVKVFPCFKKTRDGRSCQNQTTLLSFFSKNTIEFKMEDNLLSPEIYKTPVEPQRKDINAPVFLTIYQKIYSYIQIVFIETDEDLTGLNFFAKDKREQYPKYENSMLIAAPGSASVLEKGGPICDVTMQLHQKVLTTKRKYTTLLEVLGDVGGLMEIIWTFLNLITSFITEILYEKSFVNNLFSFDIDKKLILLKNKERLIRKVTLRQSKIEDSLKINNSNSELQKSNNIELYPKEVPSPENVHLKKKKIKVKIKRRIDKKETTAIMKSTKQIQILDLEKSDNNNIDLSPKNLNEYSSSFEKSTEKNLEKEIKNYKIEKINQCCLCCMNKNKNYQKLLFDEGTKVIAEKLDIVNIFNKLLTVEKMQTHLNIEGRQIEMSDECRQSLDNMKAILYDLLINK